MINCKNPSCYEKDIHPITARDYDGCCSPLCEEILDHDYTQKSLEMCTRRAEKAEAEVKILETFKDDATEFIGALGLWDEFILARETNV